MGVRGIQNLYQSKDKIESYDVELTLVVDDKQSIIINEKITDLDDIFKVSERLVNKQKDLYYVNYTKQLSKGLSKQEAIENAVENTKTHVDFEINVNLKDGSRKN